MGNDPSIRLDDQERTRAYIVWESLERAADHLTEGHPAALHIRRALDEAEAYWRTLAPHQVSGRGERQDGATGT